MSHANKVASKAIVATMVLTLSLLAGCGEDTPEVVPSTSTTTESPEPALADNWATKVPLRETDDVEWDRGFDRSSPLNVMGEVALLQVGTMETFSGTDKLPSKVITSKEEERPDPLPAPKGFKIVVIQLSVDGRTPISLFVEGEQQTTWSDTKSWPEVDGPEGHSVAAVIPEKAKSVYLKVGDDETALIEVEGKLPGNLYILPELGKIEEEGHLSYTYEGPDETKAGRSTSDTAILNANISSFRVFEPTDADMVFVHVDFYGVQMRTGTGYVPTGWTVVPTWKVNGKGVGVDAGKDASGREVEGIGAISGSIPVANVYSLELETTAKWAGESNSSTKVRGKIELEAKRQ